MKILSIVIGFLSAALLCGPAAAVETDFGAGTTAMPFQQAGGTARAMGMGSAVVAVPDGSGSLLWNPAGLGQMDCAEVGLHDNIGLGGINQEIAIVGTPLGQVKDNCKGGSFGGLAADFSYIDYGSFNGTDANGVPTGNYRAEDYSGGVGWGMQMLPGLSAGIDVKVDQSILAGQAYDAYAMDLGLMYAVVPSLNLGLTYSNLNIGGNSIGGSTLDSGLRLGAGWTVDKDKHWLLAAAGELQNKGVDSIQMGTEYLIGNLEEKSNILALRAGFDVNYPGPQLSGLAGLTLGIGYTVTRSLTLDYAFLPAGDLGNSHQLSLTFKFNCLTKPHPAAVVPVAEVVTATEVAVAVEPLPIVVKSIILTDEHFDFDKSTLTPQGIAALKENIQVMKDNPKAMVRVAGYTSMSGTAEYNQLLSERRAAAVEEYMVTNGGIDPKRISTIGYGATEPATYESKPTDINSAAAKSNMRVLFEVLAK